MFKKLKNKIIERENLLDIISLYLGVNKIKLAPSISTNIVSVVYKDSLIDFYLEELDNSLIKIIDYNFNKAISKEDLLIRELILLNRRREAGVCNFKEIDSRVSKIVEALDLVA